MIPCDICNVQGYGATALCMSCGFILCGSCSNMAGCNPDDLRVVGEDYDEAVIDEYDNVWLHGRIVGKDVTNRRVSVSEPKSKPLDDDTARQTLNEITRILAGNLKFAQRNAEVARFNDDNRKETA